MTTGSGSVPIKDNDDEFGLHNITDTTITPSSTTTTTTTTTGSTQQSSQQSSQQQQQQQNANNMKKRKSVQRLTTIAREQKIKELRICVGDKVVLNNDKEGYVHFIGPVQTDKKGLIEYYGIEMDPPHEGSCDGTFFNRKYFFPKNRSGVFVSKRDIQSIVKPINGKRFTIHDKVKVKGRSNGEIKFIGPTLFGPNTWYGVELDTPLGRNNGMVQGIRYFEARTQSAVFVREEALISLDKSGNPKQVETEYPVKPQTEMASDLFVACAKGDLKTVRNILNIDPIVAKHAVDPYTEASALMTACYHGYYLVVNELLKTKQINVNETNYHGLNALHFAAQAGYDKILELLIQHNADINARTEDGITALYIAVEKGHELVVEKLLSNNADVNISSRDEESPLIQACHRGFDKIVARLLSASNIRVNQKRKADGATALFAACREGHTECVRQLLSNQQIRVNECKTNGRSPLFIASFFGHLEIVDLLLKHSAKMTEQHIEHGIMDVDQCDSKGFTPLFVAAQNGHTEIVKLLLEYGADVNKAEQRGHTPLWISGLRGHIDVVRVLLAHPDIDIDYKDLSGVSALWAACQNNNVQVVELLLHPRDVEAKVEPQGHSKKITLTNSEGLNLLINEAEKRNEELDLGDLNFDKLEESEEEDDEKNKDKTKKQNNEEDSDSEAREEAVRQKRENSLSGVNKGRHFHQRTNSRLLWKKKGQRKGADPNLAKHDGCTPLWIAASRGNHECIKHLIHYGANLDIADRSQGATPLFVACQNGKKEAVELLLAAGASVNKPRHGDGTTPLMMAAHNGHSEIVDLLLKSGADPMRSNSTGLNALGCAAMQGHSRIVKLCYQHLCRVKSSASIRKFVNSGDQANGWTPLHLACMGGHMRVIRYLIEKAGVDIFQKDYENKTAMEHAWQNGHQEIVTWLSQLEKQYNHMAVI